MRHRVEGNVIYLGRPLHWPTHCLDCDPQAARPFRMAVREDARTGDILTPCPACGHHALVDVPNATRPPRFGTAS